MADTVKEIVIRTSGGQIVARMNVEESVLHGLCEWYDGWSNLVACGFFKSGLPFTGTFLNWPKFFGESDDEHSYDPQTYCKDWVTIFEAGFDSELPKYERVVEAYCKGQKI